MIPDFFVGYCVVAVRNPKIGTGMDPYGMTVTYPIGKISQVVAFANPCTCRVESPGFVGMSAMPKTPTDHHNLMVRLSKFPIGTSIMFGILDWRETSDFLEMSAQVAKQFTDDSTP
jgi:hypothetical protein